MPTLIPTIKGITAEIGGGIRPETLVPIIAIGSHLVTVSPFSTLGALAIASTGSDIRDRLFRQMMLAAFIYLILGAVISSLVMLWN